MAGFHNHVKKLNGTNGRTRKNVLEIAREVSATIGAEFFGSVVRHLSQTLDADCVYVGEFVGGQMERVRGLAALIDGEADSTVDYVLAGSAAAEVACGRSCSYAGRVRQLFPDDELLSMLRAESLVALPLADANGHAMGLIAAIYRTRGHNVGFAQSILEVFAPRAAAELGRQQNEEALRESEQRYRAFIEQSTDAMWRLEFETSIPIDLPEDEQIRLIYQRGYIAECNRVAAQLVGLTEPAQFIGARVGDIAPASDPRFLKELRSAIRAQYRFAIIEATAVDGEGNASHRLRSQWGIIEKGALRRIWFVTKDITELKRAELARDTLSRRLYDVLENLHLVAVMLDRDGRITFCNDYLAEAAGWNKETLIGTDWFDWALVEDRERWLALFQSAMSGSQGPDHFEGGLVTRDGNLHQIAWDCTVLRDAESRPTGLAALGRDVTKQKTLEAHFHQTQKLESIGRVASGLAHDFNNLLTLISGHTRMLLATTSPFAPGYESLAGIEKAAGQGAVMIERLLSFSRQQAVVPTVVDLNALIMEDRHILEPLLRGDVQLTMELTSDLGRVSINPGELHQVVMNLAVNARDAMSSGGELKITTGNVELGEDAGLSPGPYVSLTVADSGVGMPEEVQSHLFEPFFTTKEHGTGLGLCTAYGIIRRSGGDILVQSAVGKGTTLTIYLPRVLGN